MLKWAVIFLILGLICGGLGLNGAEGVFYTLAKILGVLFLVVFGIFLVLGIVAAKKVV